MARTGGGFWVIHRDVPEKIARISPSDNRTKFATIASF
jgi:hypothetical protein